MEDRPDRGYWAGLIPKEGCQSWKGKEAEQVTRKMTIREEIWQAVKAINTRGRPASFKDIVEELKKNRVISALTELEREGKARQTPDGKWELTCKA
jgi:Mn-dependent DtxR family transcriptional regulator